jgi:hypothetical protein
MKIPVVTMEPFVSQSNGNVVLVERRRKKCCRITM